MYWDTSALLKAYIPESDSDYFLGLLATGNHLVCTSVITSVEFRCALNRKAQADDLRPSDVKKAMERFTRDCHEGRITQLACAAAATDSARELVDLAATKPKSKSIMIRSLDAIHIASALSVRAAGLVTTDQRMREVAATLNLKLLPPTGTS
jgi:predicted nucleic acid-binding protein